MIKFCLLATMVAITYATPIRVITATSEPPPSIACPNELCATKQDGNYRHTADPSFFVTCQNEQAHSCQRCDRAGLLHFSENCNQCRQPADADSTECDYYTGSTQANRVCSDDDNKYAIWFCQNLYRLDGYGAAWAEAHGDFAYDSYDANSFQKIEGQGKSRFYISCVGGVHGWCRFCQDGLVWYHTTDDNGNVELDGGICDYPREARR